MYILPVENRVNKHAHYRKRMHTCEYNGPSLRCFVPQLLHQRSITHISQSI